MFNTYRPYYAEINLDNFRHNFREVKRLAKGKKTFGVIKADGYGHGAVELARVLDEEGADYFAVAVITEALELRRAGYDKPILIMGFTPSTFAKEIVESDITQAVFSYEQAEALSIEAQSQSKTAKIHIKIDTGMGRVGYLPSEESIVDIKSINNLKNIYIEGIFTHFATADELDKEFSRLQIEKFTDVVEKLRREGIEIEIRHIANSAGIIDIEESYFDAVRPGIMLYGYYPSSDVCAEKLTLKPVMTLKANIVHIKEVAADTPISYGRKFRTDKISRIATLPFGYADGFTRLLFGKAQVIANGRMAPVVGRICMDQCMIDVTECGDVSVGDEVIVMGSTDQIDMNADYIAGLLGTISYEVLCAVSKRVPRVFVENGKIIGVKNYV
jgi:alanine racemase